MKTSGGSPSRRSLQLVADADDLAVVAQHLDVAAHGQLLVRPPGLEAARRPSAARRCPAAASAGQRACRPSQQQARPAGRRTPRPRPSRTRGVASIGSAGDAARRRRRGSRSSGRRRRPPRASAAASAAMAARASSSVRPSRYSSLCICLTAAMRSALKSRRRRPTTLKPRTASGLPSTSMKGGTSCDTALAKPTMACAPTLTNWWMPVRPPTVTQSPSSHVAGQRGVVGHGRVVAHHAVVRDVGVGHDPVVVADAGDGLVLHRADVKVPNSRMVLRSPITSSAGLARVLLVLVGRRRCEPNWKMRLSRPMVVWPSITHVRGRPWCRRRSSRAGRSRV